MYSAIFPEDVKSYFGVDYLVGSYSDDKERAAGIGEIIDKKIKLALRDHSASTKYTWEEAKNVWIKGTDGSLDDRSAEILMQRGLDKLPDGKYIFSRDHRLKAADINLLNQEQLYVLAENANVHVRFVRGSKSDFFNKGKWWGKKSIQPVIAVHGWQDNAGSWDPLAEIMPDDYSILAIDLPGNGRSSHLPHFQNYYFNDAVAIMRRIKRYFKWDKVDILGHSGGSATCFMYTAVFPEDVKSYFGIDFLVDSYGDEEKRIAKMGETIDKKIQLALRDHSSSKKYSWEEAKNVWIKATDYSLDDKSAEILMQRGLDRLSDGKYIFSRDHRLKGADINLLNEDQLRILAENANVHIRLVRASKSNIFDGGKIRSQLIASYLTEGKWWRKNEEQPVLALHGLFDNAATFDTLIPLLNENISVLSLDIPGFGRSSSPPAGMSPNFLELVIWMRYLIKDYFKWKKVNLLGHSFGSNLSFSYSGMFPEEVDKFISIDCGRFNMAAKPEHLLDDLRRGYMGGVVKTLEIPYEGDYQLHLDYILKMRSNPPFKLSKRFCELFLSRDLEKITDDVYRNLTDRRVHLKYMGRPTYLFLDALAEKIKCKMLVIRPTGGVLVKHRKEMLEKQLSIIAQNSPRLVYEVVEGGHHVHLENPEKVAPIINKFFET
ncbi:unnamed protein product [Nezara viridula]|nr:unnamed protein product [Nezara viridula]